METKKSEMVEIVSFLIILNSLYKIMLSMNFNIFKLLFQPLSYKIIVMWYVVSIIALALMFLSGIGVLFSKDIFRKIILVITSFMLLSYLAEGPFFYFRNFPKLVERTITEINVKVLNIPISIFSSILCVIIILFWVIDVAFSIGVVYFFTRPKVREQFN